MNSQPNCDRKRKKICNEVMQSYSFLSRHSATGIPECGKNGILVYN